jgi:hypothetical protein
MGIGDWIQETPCPTCGAKAGEACKGVRVGVEHHPERILAKKKAAQDINQIAARIVKDATNNG